MKSNEYPAMPPLERGLRRRLFEWGYGRQFESGVRKILRSASWIAFSLMLVWQNPAVRGDRLRGLSRFVVAQFLRQSNRTYEVDLGESGILVCPPWSSIGTLIASTGAHEPGEQHFVHAFVRPGDAVIDAGANIGSYTIPIAKQGAKVIAFEPAGRAREVLEAGVKRSGVEANVLLLPQALSDFDGVGEVTTDLDLQNYLVDQGESGMHPQSFSREEVEVRTMDSALQSNASWIGSAPITLMKIDVEGQDEKVLGGAAKTIERYRPVIMVESQYGGQSIRAQLERWDHGIYWFNLGVMRLVEIPPQWSGNYQFHTNLIAIPREKEEFVRERLRTASVGAPSRPRLRWRSLTS